MATAGSILGHSGFSTGVLFSKSWSDGQLVSSGSGSAYRHVYFVASVFTFRCYIKDVWIGYGLNAYELQYWNGSSWVTEHRQTNIGDKDSYMFEINITTSESASNGKYRANSDRIWWRLRINNTNNYYPSFNTGVLKIYGLGAHLDYNNRIKGRYIKGYLKSSQGTPYVHSSSSVYDVTPAHSWVSDLYNNTSLKGTVISAGIPEYAVLPDNY